MERYSLYTGNNRITALIMVLVLAAAATFAGCLGSERVETAPPPDVSAPAPAEPHRETVVPVSYAPGVAAEENDKAVIDFSNASDGYVMVKFLQSSSNSLIAVINGPGGGEYVYELDPGEYAVFSFTEGDGQYVIALCEQTDDMKYKVILRAHVDVALTDPFAPFLRPNRYVNYSAGTMAVRRAAELAEGAADLVDVIAAVYDYVTASITYDMEMVGAVESGYMPDLDAVLERGKGICFDYAAVITGMLRSLAIPTKMVFGYLDDYYHAWISVYSEDEGWIDGIIFFDGHSWMLMDPTFTSGMRRGGEAAGIAGNTADYIAKLYY